MQEPFLNKKAQSIRDVIRYIQKFKDAVVIVYLDDEVIESPLFSLHMRDISFIKQAGLKVVIVPGARNRIDQILTESGLTWEYKDDIRITADAAIPQIKMAAFDTSNTVMTSLAANGITATIGNWVRARAKGVIDGTDFGTAGDIEKINSAAILSTLDSGFVPIFPCIGWSATGKPYNISSIQLAKSIAESLKADKLFFVLKDAEINAENFCIPEEIGVSETGDVPAMNLEELQLFVEHNKNSVQKKSLSLLQTAALACKNGVTRAHILNGSLEGVLPCEIFSDLGSGTMIYSENYGKIRAMAQADIPAVLSVMNPFIQKKILLPRTEQNLADKISDYIVYEVDGGIRACAALHKYSDGQAEIAGIAVDEAFSNLGIGPKLVHHLLTAAKNQRISTVFILTTQTGDWFEKMGFKLDVVESLPKERRTLWTPERNSKVFRFDL